MVTELGQTNDPKALIPGDPASVHDIARSLSGYADALHNAGAGLRRIDTADGWSGPAADGFRRVFHGQPGKWLEAGDSFAATGNAMDDYGSTLAWTQSQAEQAIQEWDQAQATTQAARRRHALAVDQAQRDAQAKTAAGIPTAAPDIPFVDPGQAGRQAAQALLARARSQLASAAIHHPGDIAEIAAGAAITTISAAGEGGGLLLDATGVGAVAGAPLNALAAAGIATGVGITGAAVANIASHAAGDDHLDSGGTGGGTQPPFEPPSDITGASDHAAAQIAERNGHGVSDAAMRDAVKNPVKPPEYRPDQYGGSYRFTGKDAVVNLNQNGQITTAWAKSTAGWRNP